MTTERYPADAPGEYQEDDGTIPNNVAALEEAVVGHRIINVEYNVAVHSQWVVSNSELATVITLDNGKSVILVNTYDCCAFTELTAFLLSPDAVDHIITGVGTTDGYTTWHIYADMGDVLALTVGWSCGNPFYYVYGFEIRVLENILPETP